ncbi:MAG: 16S rRNA (cytosine(967)-C(5))-methyltransferase RsmB [Candidatus Korobacteraceae bacterium]|jgi:16S rRNA (cytosine967-C5)-methyltransferase
MPIAPARTAAFDILLRVDQQGAYASELLHSGRLELLSQADRALTTELVMGVLRWRSRLDEAIAAASARTLAKVDPEVLTALRLGAYQLQYLSRIPAHAAINDSVELVKRAHKRSAAPFANGVLRKIATTKITPEPGTPDWTAALLAGEFAHPQWLVERWVAEFGVERAHLICRHGQQIPNVAIRIDDPAAQKELEAEGVKLAAGALLAGARIATGGDITRTRAFQEGRVFILDEASQLVAALVGSGSRVLDCCAAPGGKTQTLAARNPSAEIVAAELLPRRAELLRKRLRAANVQVIQADALHLPTSGGFDRVLADVPCSGTGTLSRNPEIKWRLKPEDLGYLHVKQVAILRAALSQLAPGGRALYSTCSLEREENEAVVEEVLREQQEYRLRDCREELEWLRSTGELVWSDVESLLSGKFLRTIPGVQPCDGFFAGMVERRD